MIVVSWQSPIALCPRSSRPWHCVNACQVSLDSCRPSLRLATRVFWLSSPVMEAWLRAAQGALPAGWPRRFQRWRQRVGGVILLGTLCSGCDLAPLLLCQLFLSVEVAVEGFGSSVEAGGEGQEVQTVQHLFACECKPAARKWIQRCLSPAPALE